jgi:hypothetical protein
MGSTPLVSVLLDPSQSLRPRLERTKPASALGRIPFDQSSKVCGRHPAGTNLLRERSLSRSRVRFTRTVVMA